MVEARDHLLTKTCQTAIIKESLRIMALPTTRFPLVSPNDPLRYKSWEIPAGVSIIRSFVIQPIARTVVGFARHVLYQMHVAYNLLLDPH